MVVKTISSEIQKLIESGILFGIVLEIHARGDDHMNYSRASDNGPSEKRTTSLQRTSAVLPIEFSIVIVH